PGDHLLKRVPCFSHCAFPSKGTCFPLRPSMAMMEIRAELEKRVTTSGRHLLPQHCPGRTRSWWGTTAPPIARRTSPPPTNTRPTLPSRSRAMTPPVSSRSREHFLQEHAHHELRVLLLVQAMVETPGGPGHVDFPAPLTTLDFLVRHPLLTTRVLDQMSPDD